MNLTQHYLIEEQKPVRVVEEELMETLSWEQFRQCQMVEMNNKDTESMERIVYCNLVMEKEVNLALPKLTHVNL